MRMSPSEEALSQLHGVADHVREVFSERHHHITTALNKDDAFRDDRNPLSSLVRSIVKAAVKVGASRQGLQAEPCQGGLELLRGEGSTIHHYRVRAATRDREGSIQVIVNSDPTDQLRSGDYGYDGGFIVDKHWVFGYTYDDDGFIDELFVAAVLGVTNTKVLKLELGPTMSLGLGADSTPPSRSFKPSEEDLDGFEDDDSGTDDVGDLSA